MTTRRPKKQPRMLGSESALKVKRNAKLWNNVGHAQKNQDRHTEALLIVFPAICWERRETTLGPETPENSWERKATSLHHSTRKGTFRGASALGLFQKHENAVTSPAACGGARGISTLSPSASTIARAAAGGTTAGAGATACRSELFYGHPQALAGAEHGKY
ncbi:uncharacterized protein LOC144902175 isoform X1 [Branchiostoma floridae x Branchiostoma belcheri]